MLSITEFRVLSDERQALYLWKNGKYLASKQIDHYKINLYGLHTFFVEVWYDSSKRTLHQIDTFTAEECLNKYPDRFSKGEGA